MTIHDRILKLLKDHPKLRDSDQMLIWTVWYQLGFNSGETMTKTQFMDSRLPSPESVRRSRQKIQENHPELQASEAVRKARGEKEKEKGTFVYREETTPASPITGNGHFEKRNGIDVWVIE